MTMTASPIEIDFERLLDTFVALLERGQLLRR